MKKAAAFLLAVVLCFTASVTALADYANFTEKATYDGRFSDVAEEDWFYEPVKRAFELGLTNGTSDTAFSPRGTMTLAEAITFAVRINSLYATGEQVFFTAPEGGKWYDPYVAYAIENGITKGFDHYEAVGKRSEIAVLFANALPEDAYPQTRTVPDNAIPDVGMEEMYSDAVYKLYRAGILLGDENNAFNADSGITRSEIAAICVRLADPTQRSTKDLDEPLRVLTAQEISEKCASSVFFVECCALNGTLAGTGSGFFISKDGLAVTNYHVAANTSGLRITLTSGEVLTDVSIISADVESDLALLRVRRDDGTADFPYLRLGDSAELKQGQQVYAIGSPLGLENTMSQGIIANPRRVIDGVTYVQISVPIAQGSSGGALLDEYGRVIGVTSAGFIESTGDLNLAMPINLVAELDKASDADLFIWYSTPYEAFNYAIDYGVFTGVRLIKEDYGLTDVTYYYDLGDFYGSDWYTAKENLENANYYYNTAMQNAGFDFVPDDYQYDGVYTYYDETVTVTTNVGGGLIVVHVTFDLEFYEDFPAVPDFGYITGLKPTSVKHSNGHTTYGYSWGRYYTNDEMENYLAYYKLLLDSLGMTDASTDSALIYHGFDTCVTVTAGDVGTYIYVDLVREYGFNQ